MQSNTLNLNKDLLLTLMQDFYILSRIRIVIFDSNFQEILAWPTTRHCFCEMMHSIDHTQAKCIERNQSSFSRCRKKRSLEVFHCHAGLVEATAPLIDNGCIIGYIMFGQISDCPNQKETYQHLQSVFDSYQLQKPTNPAFYEIVHKTPIQIQAAAKILEACTFYVILKDMVTFRRKNFTINLNNFLMEHLSEDLSVERLMEEFQISRNKLYDSVNKYLGIGIAEHIKALRIKEAKRLLRETNLAVCEISDMVGFNDYNTTLQLLNLYTLFPEPLFCRINKQY